MLFSKLAFLSSLALTNARDIPPNVRSFYNAARSGSCTGDDMLQGGFYDQDDGSAADFGYCQKYMAGKGFYLKGPGTLLANMDIDCDGVEVDDFHGDKRCYGSDDTQYETRWKEEVHQMGGISDLNTYIHPYVVLGNEGNYNPTFDPRTVGVKPLSLVAVVCGEKLIYGVWGDTNGDDGEPLIGEASLALATECFGQGMDADHGHDPADVLYIAFSGEGAVPKDALWDASSYAEFEASITKLGDSLVAGLGNSTLARRFH